MKIYKLAIFVVLIMLCSAGYAHAQIINNPFGLAVPVSLPFQSQLEMRLCMIRRIFCGSLVGITVTISVFVIGIMTLNNKIHWGTAILMIAGIVIFVEADSMTKFFGKRNYIVFISSPLCSCKCKADNFPLDLGLIGNFILDQFKDTTDCDPF